MSPKMFFENGWGKFSNLRCSQETLSPRFLLSTPRQKDITHPLRQWGLFICLSPVEMVGRRCGGERKK